MKKYEILIFATGAVSLALELLASRIMTPYFGVSLYIWAGILSITLTFLAIGYRFGGKISSESSDETIEALILATPVASAAAMGLATVVYPVAFPSLSQLDLILGSFVGATLLLALPLIALSAMNPLLISLQRSAAGEGDSGAGRIFFLSTVGSVAGVLMTAFIFIPNMTNFRAVLMLCVFLCIATIVLALAAKNVAAHRRRQLIIASVMVALACGALSVGKQRYLELVNKTSNQADRYTVLAEYTSMYGNIKVAEVRRIDGSRAPRKVFIQDGLVQSETDLNNTSLAIYTHVFEVLSHSFSPEAKDALVLGLGAGIVPTNFERAGMNVTVVEINPTALQAAIDHFGFEGKGIDVHVEDARTFVRRCESAYDVAIVDLFLGDNIPDYLTTREFFQDLRHCIRGHGSIVMNIFLDNEDVAQNMRLMATIGDAFPNLFVAGIAGGNAFVVATSGPAPTSLTVPDTGIPEEIASRVRWTVSRTHPVSPEVYADSQPISDEHNVFSVIYSDANMIERQEMIRGIPPDILVN